MTPVEREGDAQGPIREEEEEEDDAPNNTTNEEDKNKSRVSEESVGNHSTRGKELQLNLTDPAHRKYS